jgi:hypothetical protein
LNWFTLFPHRTSLPTGAREAGLGNRSARISPAWLNDDIPAFERRNIQVLARHRRIF